MRKSYQRCCWGYFQQNYMRKRRQQMQLLNEQALQEYYTRVNTLHRWICWIPVSTTPEFLMPIMLYINLEVESNPIISIWWSDTFVGSKIFKYSIFSKKVNLKCSCILIFCFAISYILRLQIHIWNGRIWKEQRIAYLAMFNNFFCCIDSCLNHLHPGISWRPWSLA